MSLEFLTDFFQWSTLFGMAIYALTAIVSIYGRDFMYGLHNKWFEMPREAFNVAIYAYLGVFKIMLTLFFLVPYLALLVMN